MLPYVSLYKRYQDNCSNLAFSAFFLDEKMAHSFLARPFTDPAILYGDMKNEEPSDETNEETMEEE